MKTTLVIMAAGIGSRYGAGIKQLAAVGPRGEIIMDYSVHDAIAAGFTYYKDICPKNFLTYYLYNGEKKYCSAEDEDWCIRYYIEKGYVIPKNATPEDISLLKIKYWVPRNASAQARIKKAEFFEKHPEYNVTAIQWGKTQNKVDKVPGKRYLDIDTHKIYVIRKVNSVNIEVYCDRDNGTIIRKTDGQIKKDRDQLRYYEEHGKWIDPVSAEYIDETKWNDLLEKIKEDKSVLSSWYEADKLETYEDLYAKSQRREPLF